MNKKISDKDKEDWENFLRDKEKIPNKDFIVNKKIIIVIKVTTLSLERIKIFCKLIKKNSTGTYNVSIGKKIYLNQIIKWLNYYNKNDYKHVELQKTHNNDSFTLNNQKLMNKISIPNRIVDLKNDCKMISKNFFNNK